jgi:hypothetical protein
MSTSPVPDDPVDELKAQASEAVRKVSASLNDQANILRDTATSARYNTQEFPGSRSPSPRVLASLSG